MSELEEAEKDLFELGQKVNLLRAQSEPVAVKNYIFKTLQGDTSLLDLFSGRDFLFLIHNMGQGCRYCTLWADGLNGFVPHMESEYALALVSKDDPHTQRAMANSRSWNFRLASHQGGQYIKEQTVMPGNDNYPGMVCYIKKGNDIFRKNAVIFGPGDEFCSIWNILALAGKSPADWTPQYHYWKRPQVMDDGGDNLI